MRVVTVCEPCASGIVFGGKDIENRKTNLPLFGNVLIQAGRSLEWFKPDVIRWMNERWSGCPLNPLAAIDKFKGNFGQVIGIACFGKGRRFDAELRLNRWATGPWCHPVQLVKPLPPFPVRGQMGVFRVPWDLIPAESQKLIDKFMLEAEDLPGQGGYPLNATP